MFKSGETAFNGFTKLRMDIFIVYTSLNNKKKNLRYACTFLSLRNNRPRE